MSKEEEAKILDKVRKLLALSSSPNEAEATSAAEKAHALLKAYNLSLSSVPGEEGEKAVRSDSFSVAHEEEYKTSLLARVAHFNYCDVIRHKEGGGETRYEIFGREANVAATLAMFSYLSTAIRRISEKAKKSEIIEDFSYRDFRMAMVLRLGERMREIRAAENSEETGTALMVVNTEARNAMIAAYPYVGRARIKGPSESLSSAMGRSAADTMSLNQQIRG